MRHSLHCGCSRTHSWNVANTLKTSTRTETRMKIAEIMTRSLNAVVVFRFPTGNFILISMHFFATMNLNSLFNGCEQSYEKNAKRNCATALLPLRSMISPQSADQLRLLPFVKEGR